MPRRRLRIGGVPYGVGAPLVGGLETADDVDFVAAHPTTLIPMLRAGELDTALVSTIEAIRQPGYRIAPGLGIACKTEIRSVRAFHRPGPIRTVGVDQSSATSVALLRLLLQNVRRDAVPGGDVGALQFETIVPTRTPADLPHDLVMMIGDIGLAADPGDREPWDLGADWVDWTGLPFVFAAWITRGDVEPEPLLTVLRRAREVGRDIGAVDGTRDAAHYDLDADDARGLRRYWAECRKAGLADHPDADWLM